MNKPLIGFASDLKNNYDRMIHGAAGMVISRLGVPPNAIDYLLKTISGMKHYVHTAYGDSKTHYSGDTDAPYREGVKGIRHHHPCGLPLR